MSRMWIQHGEIHRQQKFPDVAHHGDDGIGHALVNRQCRRYRAAATLNEKRHHARDSHEQEKRCLLRDQPRQRFRFPRDRPHRASPPPRPPQRPKIQQQHYARQRHEHRLRHQPERARAQRHHVESPRPTAHSARPPPLDVARIEPQHREPKKSAQHVLPFRHPSHGLHPQRMPRKERRKKRTRPQRPGQPTHHQEREHRVERVPPDTRGVMPVRIEAEHRRVEQMRHPRQRVPVRRLTRCHRPTHGFKTQTRPHLRVGRHIIRVIVIDEIVPDRTGEEQ